MCRLVYYGYKINPTGATDGPPTKVGGGGTTLGVVGGLYPPSLVLRALSRPTKNKPKRGLTSIYLGLYWVTVFD